MPTARNSARRRGHPPRPPGFRPRLRCGRAPADVGGLERQRAADTRRAADPRLLRRPGGGQPGRHRPRVRGPRPVLCRSRRPGQPAGPPSGRTRGRTRHHRGHLHRPILRHGDHGTGRPEGGGSLSARGHRLSPGADRIHPGRRRSLAPVDHDTAAPPCGQALRRGPLRRRCRRITPGLPHDAAERTLDAA